MRKIEKIKNGLAFLVVIATIVSLSLSLLPEKNEMDEAKQETIKETSPIVDTEPVLSETEAVDVEEPEPEFFANEYGTYRKVDEEVATEGGVFLRSYPNGKKITSVEQGTRLTRIGISDENGWSIVLYNDKEAYLPTYYLTTVKNPVYTEVDEVVIVLEDANLRFAPSINSQLFGKVSKGDELERVAIGSNGWSRVFYKDGIAYIFTPYVALKDNVESETEIVNETESIEATANVTEPVEVETEPQDEVPISQIEEYEENGVIYKVVNENVEAARTVNVRSGPGVEYERLGRVAGGKTILRIAIGNNGWSKVIFKGQEAFILSEYLLG